MARKIKFPVISDEMHEWLLDNRQTTINSRQYVICAWCGHDWHASQCRRPGVTCRCDSSQSRPDETWRPMVAWTNSDQVLRIMHDTGIDGWSAGACVGIVTITTPPRPSPARLRNLVYGL